MLHGRQIDTHLTISVAIIFVALCFFAWPYGILFISGVGLGATKFRLKNIIIILAALMTTLLLWGNFETNKGPQGLAFELFVFIVVFIGLFLFLFVSSTLGARCIKDPENGGGK